MSERFEEQEFNTDHLDTHLWRRILKHFFSYKKDLTIIFISMISMAIIAKVTNLHVRDFTIYLIIDGLFGIIPIIFYFTGLLTVQYPSLICVAASIISLVALLIFEGENMRGELKRRLHL